MARKVAITPRYFGEQARVKVYNAQLRHCDGPVSQNLTEAEAQD